MMRGRRGRTTPLLVIAAIAILVLLGGRGASAGPLPELPYVAGITATNDELQLAVTVTPPVVRPGDSIAVSLRLTNHTAAFATPEVALDVPAGLETTDDRIPAGTTFNVLSHAFSWQPVVAAGDVAEVTLSFMVRVADLTTPSHTISATLKHAGGEDTVTASYWVGVPPQATITVSPAQVAVGQPVQLLANAVGPGPFSQLWQLGDGRAVDADNPVVVYPLAGTYEVALELSNPLAAARARATVTVVDKPVAYFTLNDPTPAVNQPITFVNQSGGQPPLDYHWDFGDGQTADGATPTHHYAAPGAYQVKLTVDSPAGRAETTLPVMVGAAPVADVVVHPEAVVGQPFVGQAFTEEGVTTLQWEMGDGVAYEGTKVSHVFNTVGMYRITFTASNDFGSTVVSRDIVVTSGGLRTFLPLVIHSENNSILVTADPVDGNVAPAEGSLPFLQPESGGAGAAPTIASDGTAGAIPARPADGLNAPLVYEQPPLAVDATPAEQLLWYLNEARRLHGLPPLAYVYELTIAAQQHTDDLATFGNSAHEGSDGSLPPERLQWYGYRGTYAGEAVAWGFEQAVAAVEFWVNSPGHRVIILHPQANEVGVGYSVNYAAANIWYWTAEFGIGQ